MKSFHDKDVQRIVSDIVDCTNFLLSRKDIICYHPYDNHDYGFDLKNKHDLIICTIGSDKIDLIFDNRTTVLNVVIDKIPYIKKFEAVL